MPSARSSRLTNLTPENLARLAERDDTVVYEPTHDTLFEPWLATKVRSVVELVVGVAKGCATEEEARTKLRVLGGDVAEFESKYQLMVQRLTQPEIAKNRGHVEIVLQMVALRNRVDEGTLTEEGAQRLVSEQALAGLLAQAQRAQRVQRAQGDGPLT